MSQHNIYNQISKSNFCYEQMIIFIYTLYYWFNFYNWETIDIVTIDIVSNFNATITLHLTVNLQLVIEFNDVFVLWF